MEIVLTPELSEICGIHAGDGYLRNRGNKIELDITGNIEEKEYYDNHIIPLFNKFFSLNLRAKFYAKGTYGFVTTNNQFKILNELGFPFGKKSPFVKVPPLIIKSKNKILYARFLRGLFDTDGHLGFRKSYGKYKEFKIKNHHYPIIHITTISKILAEDVRLMLNDLGIKNFIVGCQPKELRESYKYRVIISGIYRLIKWMDLIGSKNPVKFSRYLIWKKFGFCPPHTILQERKDILNGKLDIYNIGL